MNTVSPPKASPWRPLVANCVIRMRKKHCPDTEGKDLDLITTRICKTIASYQFIIKKIEVSDYFYNFMKKVLYKCCVGAIQDLPVNTVQDYHCFSRHIAAEVTTALAVDDCLRDSVTQDAQFPKPPNMPIIGVGFIALIVSLLIGGW